MSHIQSIRQSELVWRFESTTLDCLFWKSEAYTGADDAMRADGYLPDSARFKINPDGTFHLWVTYVADPAQA